MTASITIALDAMGGDHAPQSILDGAALAASRISTIRFLIVGDEAKVRPLVDAHPSLADKVEIIHTDVVVAPHDKPSTALKRGGQSSMRLAVNAVADGRAGGVVSAGNTGALMAMSKFVLKTIPGIERPAIAAIFPTYKSEVVVLDLGANVECDAQNLFQFALLGDGFARAVLGISSPRVGLLNVGAEDVKGNETVKEAAALLKESGLPINFHGFVEGNDINAGVVDVVVTDGFTGNVLLKTSEGVAKMFAAWLKEAFASSLLTRVGFMLASKALKRMRHRMDPRTRGGALMLGLNGIVIKTHGGADAEAVAYAIAEAHKIISFQLNARIIDEIRQTHLKHEPLSRVAKA